MPSDGAVSTIDDFEGTIPFSSGNPGIFTFSSDAASTPTLTQVAADDRPGASAGNHALRVAYTVGGYGGFVHDLANPQDWSTYDGFSFWVKGTGSGQKVEFEVKDGGADAENGELWQAFFTDDTNGWKKVQVAFANMKRRTDFQPGGAPNDGVLNLTKMWGYAVNLPGWRRDQHARVRRRAGVREPADLRRLRGRKPDHRSRYGSCRTPASSPGAATATARRRCRSRSSTGPA